MAEHCWVGWWWLKCVYLTTGFFFFCDFILLLNILAVTLCVALLSLPVICSQKSDIFLPPLSLHLSVSDEGRDLLSCLTLWAGLRVCSPSLLPTPPLPVSLFGRATLPHQCSDYKSPVCSFWECASLSGHSHWWGELIATLLCSHCLPSSFPVLLSSFFLLFPLIVSLRLYHSSFLCWQHTLGVFTLHSVQVPQWPFYFLTLFILVYFHELCRHFLLFCHWPFTACTHTIVLTFFSWIFTPTLTAAPKISRFLIRQTTFFTQLQHSFPMDY